MLGQLESMTVDHPFKLFCIKLLDDKEQNTSMTKNHYEVICTSFSKILAPSLK